VTLSTTFEDAAGAVTVTVAEPDELAKLAAPE
jgi:hypothetical protein